MEYARQKLDLDFVSRWTPVAPRRCRMDEDTIALARQLFTRAGMIMEDASAFAIVVGGKDVHELHEMAGELEIALAQGATLIAAAKTIIVGPSNKMHEL
jgi:hypothetical protein